MTEAAWRQMGHPRSVAVVIAFGWAVFLALLALFWIGPIGSDDALYWAESTGWLRHVPYVGTTHWSLRHTLVIPIAIGRALFGDGLTALVLPSILAGLGVIAVVASWVSRTAGTKAALLATALVATNPLLIRLSSTADIDFIEMVFILAAFALLQRAIDYGPSWRPLLLAGALLGMALMSRETAVFAVAAVLLLFLFGYGMNRAWYLVGALGFLAVSGGEVLYYWVMTGNPLYRLAISANHDSTIDRWTPQGAAVPLVHPLIDPITMLLLNHSFGVLFWIGLPLTVWLGFRRREPAQQRTLFILLGCLSLTWAVLAAALWRELPLVPRYFATAAIGVSVLAGIALMRLFALEQTRLAETCFGLLVAGNLLATAADNRNFMYGERVLTGLAARTDAVIHTDEQTQRRAELFLEWRGLGDRVVTTPPRPGDLFFYNPTRVPADYPYPQAGWEVVERTAPPSTWGQLIVASLPFHLPPAVGQKLGPGHPGVVLYRDR